MPPIINRVWQFLYIYPKFTIGLFLVSCLIVISILSPVLITDDPIRFNLTDKFQGPSSAHWFGTDNYGRDIYSRVVMGAPITLLLGISAVLITLIISVPLGLFTGFTGGRIDEVLMRINDLFMALPAIFMALLLISARSSFENLLKIPTTWWFDPYPVIAIGITMVPRASRIIRSVSINIKYEEFIDACRARGESTLYIMFREILPNILPTIIVEGGIRISYAIIMGATLSFLGLGASPPAPAWGLMIYESKTFLYLSPWGLIFPSIALSSGIVIFNLFGDGLRDILDPMTRRTGIIQ
jgi:peptide/nickel transport system permease protein